MNQRHSRSVKLTIVLYTAFLGATAACSNGDTTTRSGVATMPSFDTFLSLVADANLHADVASTLALPVGTYFHGIAQEYNVELSSASLNGLAMLDARVPSLAKLLQDGGVSPDTLAAEEYEQGLAVLTKSSTVPVATALATLTKLSVYAMHVDSSAALALDDDDQGKTVGFADTASADDGSTFATKTYDGAELGVLSCSQLTSGKQLPAGQLRPTKRYTAEKAQQMAVAILNMNEEQEQRYFALMAGMCPNPAKRKAPAS